ncbi:sulfotransferase [archaeon]|nr:MAG: sulfotransferase [archaeon]
MSHLHRCTMEKSETRACACRACGKARALLLLAAHVGPAAGVDRIPAAGGAPLTPPPSGEMQGTIEGARTLLIDHARDVNAAWELHSLTTAFFPTPYRKFVLTGSLPPLADVLRAQGSLADAVFVAVHAAVCLLLEDGMAELPPCLQAAVDALSPVFVVGCGRSGTTLITSLLGSHERIIDFNEARALWIPVIPAFDVWSCASCARGGRLQPDLPVPAVAAASQKLRRTFLAAALTHPKFLNKLRTKWCTDDAACALSSVCTTWLDAGFVLLEKLPENAFRLPLLGALFPRARFIHIVRHAVDVASSIAKFSQTAWYGFEGAKWHAIFAYASAHALAPPEFAHTPDMLCRGLIEWAATMHAVRTASDAWDARSTWQPAVVTYEALVARPHHECNRLLAHMRQAGDGGVLATTPSKLRLYDARDAIFLTVKQRARTVASTAISALLLALPGVRSELLRAPPTE